MKANPKAGLSRRDMLRIGAGALLAIGHWPGRLRAIDNGRGSSFTFVALNDMHFSSPRCPDWFARVGASIRSLRPQPEFCLAIGDLGDRGTRSELGPMRDVLRSFSMDFHVVMGNHDHTSETDRSVWDQIFPDRINYHFRHRGWQFVGMDSTEGQKYMNTRIQPAALSWLDDTLPKLERSRPTLLFTHFPLGAGVMMRPLNADDVLARFTNFNLAAVLNGHFHGFTERVSGATTITTNRCCAISRDNHDGTAEKGYFLCTAHEGRLQRRFIEVLPT